jgi:hypothetical protein
MQADRGKTVIKSIRMSSTLEERLAAVCRRRNITESAYLSEALDRQILLEPITPALEGITIEMKMLRSIVSLADRESVVMLGAEAAKRDLPFALDLLDLPLRKESLLVFLREIAADCWHWFRVGLNPKSETRVLLYHHLGMNWSQFLNSFLVEAFTQAPEAPPTMIVTERLVKIEWPESRQQPTFETPTRTARDSLIIARS